MLVDTVLQWIGQYGYIAIFSLLVLGIVGLPVPDETLLTFTGYLVFQGHLSLGLAFLSCFAGSACGITLSYILGRTFGLTLRPLSTLAAARRSDIRELVQLPMNTTFTG